MLTSVKATLDELFVKHDDLLEKTDSVLIKQIELIKKQDEFLRKTTEKDEEIRTQIARIADTKHKVISAEVIAKGHLIGVDLSIDFVSFFINSCLVY